ncbi:hypothetical protein SLA2020_460160 [Shorea laevis]
MSLSKKGIQICDTKINTSSKVTTLNPNAAEFVPFSLRSSSASGSTSVADVTPKFPPFGTVGKTVLDRSESSVSNNSDDEAHQYWRSQLPDDITPDFKVMNEDDSQGIGSLSFSGLSLLDNIETSRFPASSLFSSAGGGYLFSEQLELSPQNLSGGSGFSEKMTYSASSYSEDPTLASYMHLPAEPRDTQLVNSDQLLGNDREGNPFDVTKYGFTNDMFADQTLLDNSGTNPLDFLASQFPEFSVESLEEVYFANAGDLNLTLEMLTQLEPQVDGGFSQNLNSKALSASNLSALDCPSLAVSDGQNGHPKYAGDDVQQSTNPYQFSDKNNILMFKSGSSLPFSGPLNFASAVKKIASQDSGTWKYDKNGSADLTVGSSRSSRLLANSYNTGHGRGVYADRLQIRGSERTAPVWLETGDAVANMYSELREEARDHARLCNVYLEQARQAYLFGNKALAKELSVKGQLHNVHMKVAHGKAQESIYRQRNPVGPENVRGPERMIDLHGLHVSEAISVLKHELSVLRSTARAADQRLQVYVCVGTGHHTRGSRTPARLPVAVQRYLLEEEGLDYSEPQPGLLRVVIY